VCSVEHLEVPDARAWRKLLPCQVDMHQASAHAKDVPEVRVHPVGSCDRAPDDLRPRIELLNQPGGRIALADRRVAITDGASIGRPLVPRCFQSRSQRHDILKRRRHPAKYRAEHGQRCEVLRLKHLDVKLNGEAG
jgi:hypothetical protein